MCSCNQATLILWIEKSPCWQSNVCILYCVFKALIFKVISFDVFNSERVRDTHSFCTTSDWLLFTPVTCSTVSFWLLGKHRTSSIFLQFIQQLSRVNKSAFFSISLMHTIYNKVRHFPVCTHTLQPWHLTHFSLIFSKNKSYSIKRKKIGEGSTTLKRFLWLIHGWGLCIILYGGQRERPG